MLFPAIFLLLAAWGAMFGLARAVMLRRAEPPAWGAAFLAASMAWGATTVAITELLSLGQALAQGPLLVAWTGATHRYDREAAAGPVAGRVAGEGGP